MNQSRQTHLDSLRGIAALIVVFDHYLAAFYPYTIFGSQGAYQQHTAWESLIFYPPFGVAAAGPFAVCLFFILSGYVLSYSHLGESDRRRKIFASIIKRPIRLGGLVWFTIICAALMWYYGLFFNGPAADLTGSKPWFNNYWAGDFDFYRFLINFTTSAFKKGKIYNPPLWTIKIELYGSLLVYIFLWLFGKSRYRIAVSIFLVFLTRDSLYQGFWIGLLIADIIKKQSIESSLKLPEVYQYLLLLLFIYLSSYPNYVSQKILDSTIYSFLPDDKNFGGGYSMLAALAVFLLAVTNDKVKKYLNLPVLKFLGGISYGLYAIHFLIISSFSSWLFIACSSSFSYNISFIFVLLTGLPAIVFAAYLSTRWVDNPSIRVADYVGRKVALFVASAEFKELKLSVEKLILTVREMFFQFHQQQLRLKLLSFNFYCLLVLMVTLTFVGGVWYKIAVFGVETSTFLLCLSWFSERKFISEKKIAGLVFIFPLLLLLLQYFSFEVPFPRHQIKNLLLMIFIVIAVVAQSGVCDQCRSRRIWFMMSVLILSLVMHLAGIVIWHMPNGFFDNPHYLALQSIAAVNVGFYFILKGRGVQKAVALVGVLISFLLLFLVVSHIAWVALGGSVLVWLYLLFYKRNKKIVTWIVLFLLVGGIFVTTLFDYNTALVHNDLKSLKNVSEPAVDLFNLWNDERVIIWKDAWAMQLDSSAAQWLVGHGLGSYKVCFTGYSSFNRPGVGLYPIAFVFPHNFILEVLFNSGLLGLLFFLIAIIVVVNYTLKCVDLGKVKPVLALGLFTAVFIHTFFTLPFLSRSSSIYLGLAIGFCLYTCLESGKEYLS